MINDLFNFKHEESKLSYNIYHDYSVRNLNTNNTKNMRNDFINFRLTFVQKVNKAMMITLQINFNLINFWLRTK